MNVEQTGVKKNKSIIRVNNKQAGERSQRTHVCSSDIQICVGN